jgi:cytochrome-b5 reductase
MKWFTCGVATTIGAAIQSFYSSAAHAKSDSHTKKSVFDHNFKPFVLGEVINLSDDTAIFRFLLPDEEDVFDLPACSSLQASFKAGSNIVENPIRSYTPITKNGTKGYFDLIVRKYRKGRMTEHLFSMEVGESLLFRKIQYKFRYVPNKFNNVGMIAGGTGITAMLQVMRAALDDSNDSTKLSLLFANRSDKKILLRGIIDKYAQEHSDRFKVHYTVDHVEEEKDWKYFTGLINTAMVRETMPPPDNKNVILVCGPDPMLHSLTGAALAVLRTMSQGLAYQPALSGLNNIQDVGGILGDLGYVKENVYRF